MVERNLRRMVLDLTPVVDVIMILLFGVMINSVALTEVGVKEARESGSEALRQAREDLSEASRKAQADRRRLAEAGDRADRLLGVTQQLRKQLEELMARLKQSESERELLTDRIVQQRMNLARAMARLLQLSEAELARFRDELDRLANADAEQASQLARELKQDQDPVRVYKAVRRIEEMQKVFTFVDLHLNGEDFLSVIANGQRLGRFPVRGAAPEEIEKEVSQALEAVNFNQVVLILYSYEGDARDLTVEATEQAIGSLLTHYRGAGAQRGRQFRYGRVGLVESAPATIEGE